MGFYRAFEDKYRGSRAYIKGRMRVYLPFIEPLKTIRESRSAVDLGCGRCEWLELLRETGMTTRGVDLDDGMLDACREIGIDVETGDAIAFLKALPDESQDVISGFHFAEHIPFEGLQTVVQEALRALKPAGLLILETPNPENIVVGASNFYTDPTHNHPIPLHLLSFLPEYYGFHRTKVLRLQESPELAANESPTLLDVLQGVSPDYSVVAQKTAPADMLAVFDPPFEKDYGLSLDQLAGRYEAHTKNLSRDLAGARSDLDGLRADLNGARADLNGARADLANLRGELAGVRAELENTRAQRDTFQSKLENALVERENMRAARDRIFAERERLSSELRGLTEALNQRQVEVAEYKNQYYNLLYSLSYRITAPLRAVYVAFQKINARLRGAAPTEPAAASAPAQPAAAAPTGGDDLPSEYKENRKFFQNLFQREVDRRKKESLGNRE